MPAATADPIQRKRERLDRLNEAAILQDLNPDLEILVNGESYGPELEDEANRLGVELMEAKADEAEKLRESCPESEEVKAHAYWQRRNAREARQDLAKFQRAIAVDKSIILLSPAAKGQASARESHGATTRSKGSRRGSTRSSSRSGDSGDSSDSDGPGEAGLQRKCKNAKCDGFAHSPRAEYCDDKDCKRAREADRQRRSRAKARPPKGMFFTPGPVLHGAGDGGASILTMAGVYIADRDPPLDPDVTALDRAATLWIAGNRQAAIRLVAS
jgi:hypothetical protein